MIPLDSLKWFGWPKKISDPSTGSGQVLQQPFDFAFFDSASFDPAIGRSGLRTSYQVFNEEDANKIADFRLQITELLSD